MTMHDDRIPALKEHLRDAAEDMGLEFKKIGNTLRSGCPFCPSSDGFHIFTKKDGTPGFKCHSCGESGDIIDLCSHAWGIPKGEELINRLADRYLGGTGPGYIPQVRNHHEPQKENPPKPYNVELACRQLWSDPEFECVRSYLITGRRLAPETLQALKVGAWDVFGRKCATFPYFDEKGEWRTAVFWRDSINHERGYIGGRGPSKAGIPFNAAAIFEALSAGDGRPVFVVEAQIDAVTIESVGFHAVATSSTSGWEGFAEYVRMLESFPVFVLCYDNDEKGREAQQKLAEALAGMGAPFTFFYWGGELGKFKDPNDVLRSDRELLIRSLRAAEVQPLIEANEVSSVNREGGKEMSTNPDACPWGDDVPPPPTGSDIPGGAVREPSKAKDAPASRSMFERIDELMAALESEPPRIKTGAPHPHGFEGFDGLLGGGIKHYGLYLLGGAPGKGKTAFAQNVAQNLASSGVKCLYFAIEMDREELFGRWICSVSGQNRGYVTNEIRFGRGRTLEGFKTFRDKVAPNLFVEDVRDLGDPTVETIVERSRAFKDRFPGETVVVFIDFLQLIRAKERNINKDTYERLCYVSRELVKLSKDVPLIVLSSLNREGYAPKPGESASMTYLKGSGDIESSCDWVGVLYEDSTSVKGADVKKIAVETVKSRFHSSDSKRVFQYFGKAFQFLGNAVTPDGNESPQPGEDSRSKGVTRKPKMWEK